MRSRMLLVCFTFAGAVLATANAQAYTINGTVYSGYSRNNPAKNATVDVRPYNNGSPGKIIASDQTGGQGKYRIANLPRGNFFLIVTYRNPKTGKTEKASVIFQNLGQDKPHQIGDLFTQ